MCLKEQVSSRCAIVDLLLRHATNGVASKLRKDENGVSSKTFSFAVVIRCLLRHSNELRHAMETLNRYIGALKKPRSDDGFAWYREFVTRNPVSSRMETSRPPRRPPLPAFVRLSPETST